MLLRHGAGVRRRLVLRGHPDLKGRQVIRRERQQRQLCVSRSAVPQEPRVRAWVLQERDITQATIVDETPERAEGTLVGSGHVPESNPGTGNDLRPHRVNVREDLFHPDPGTADPLGDTLDDRCPDPDAPVTLADLDLPRHPGIEDGPQGLQNVLHAFLRWVDGCVHVRHTPVGLCAVQCG